MGLPVRALAVALLALLAASPAGGGPKRWLREARIAATDLWLEMSDGELRAAIDELAEQGVNAVVVDFPLVPVMATQGEDESLKASSISPMTLIPFSRAC